MKICTNCGHEGKPIRQGAGAFAILFFTLAITNVKTFQWLATLAVQRKIIENTRIHLIVILFTVQEKLVR